MIFKNIFLSLAFVVVPALSFDLKISGAPVCASSTAMSSVGSAYVAGLKSCYDTNGDGVLSDSELAQMAYVSLCGSSCPTGSRSTPPLAPTPTPTPAPIPSPSPATNSSLLVSSDLVKLKSFFNGSNFNLTQIYTVNQGFCDFNRWKGAVNSSSNVLVVAKTSTDSLVGGFRSISCAGRSPGLSYTDPKSFIFSLSGDRVYYNKNGTETAVWCDSLFTAKPNYMEGWVGALNFY
jgi:hypothetical protein